MKKPNPKLIDEDNPGWSEEDFARARPAREVHPKSVAKWEQDKLARKGSGRAAKSKVGSAKATERKR
jgi:hypothetical protein